MSDRAPRQDWGPEFRQTVAKGRTSTVIVLLAAMIFVFATDGLAQIFGFVVGVTALFAMFPQSPIIPAVVQILPKLPVKGEGS